MTNWAGWLAPVDGYCERVGPHYWAEPVNAVTNLAFLVAAAVLWPRVRGRATGQVMVAGLALIALGAAAFWLTADLAGSRGPLCVGQTTGSKLQSQDGCAGGRKLRSQDALAAAEPAAPVGPNRVLPGTASPSSRQPCQRRWRRVGEG